MNKKEGKRKVQDTSLENYETEERFFQKSKLIARSPPTEKNEDSSMEEILKAIKDLRQEMRENFEENIKQTDLIKKELESTNRELKMMKEEMKVREEGWQEERQELLNRIQKLEVTTEKQEKEKRRNNIIIKNSGIEGPNIQSKTEAFIEEKVKVQAKITEAYEITKGIILAKIQNWQQKKTIMENKDKLKNTRVYIENDMTKQEREIQAQLRKIAKEEKSKGNETQVKYQKIVINRRTYRWEEMSKINEKAEVGNIKHNSKNILITAGNSKASKN